MKIIKSKCMFLKTAAMTMAAVLQYAAPAYAAPAGVTAGLNNLVSLVTTIITAIGTMLALWGVFEWGMAFQSNDGMMQGAALKKIAGGLIVVIAPAIFNYIVPSGNQIPE